MGWAPRMNIAEGLRHTVAWYAANRPAARGDAAFDSYFQAQYGERLAKSPH